MVVASAYFCRDDHASPSASFPTSIKLSTDQSDNRIAATFPLLMQAT